MDLWNPILLRELSSNHTVIIFDNRGMGNATTGNEIFSIGQFANDTAGLLDALNIKKTNRCPWLVDGFIHCSTASYSPS
jgi:pimeloyl-ACP methyl ester carboxylesterase